MDHQVVVGMGDGPGDVTEQRHPMTDRETVLVAGYPSMGRPETYSITR